MYTIFYNITSFTVIGIFAAFNSFIKFIFNHINIFPLFNFWFISFTNSNLVNIITHTKNSTLNNLMNCIWTSIDKISVLYEF